MLSGEQLYFKFVVVVVIVVVIVVVMGIIFWATVCALFSWYGDWVFWFYDLHVAKAPSSTL